MVLRCKTARRSTIRIYRVGAGIHQYRPGNPDSPAEKGEEESFVLTIKGGGMVMREEYELALSRAQFEGLRPKCTGRIIFERRYRYALPDGLVAEVEQSMLRFEKPDWFGEDVSQDIRYHNSYMSIERRNGES